MTGQYPVSSIQYPVSSPGPGLQLHYTRRNCRGRAGGDRQDQPGPAVCRATLYRQHGSSHHYVTAPAHCVDTAPPLTTLTHILVPPAAAVSSDSAGKECCALDMWWQVKRINRFSHHCNGTVQCVAPRPMTHISCHCASGDQAQCGGDPYPGYSITLHTPAPATTCALWFRTKQGQGKLYEPRVPPPAPPLHQLMCVPSNVETIKSNNVFPSLTAHYSYSSVNV